jgi:hypothetical protein
MRTRSKLVSLAAMALVLAGCSNPRAIAIAELQRLRVEMDRHADTFGRYPQSLDADRPASAANLPHTAPRGVAVYLIRSDAAGYQAVATRRPWSCSMQVLRGHGQRVDCNPNATSSDQRPDSAKAREVFRGVLSPDSAK